MSNLVIVESPAKTKTIGSYLGNNYKVVSSKGHIRDLSTTGKFGLGVDVDGDFSPNYIPIKGKKKDISTLKKECLNADKIYLATDPDREGEAISWHLLDELKINENNYERVVFNEITKNAIKEAFNHPRKIDMNLVKSQETRRILDRIIGFRLSKLLQTKTGGKSAGRVQSVALKLIVLREREIENFVKEEYWDITANFKDFKAELEKYNGKKIKIHNENEANQVLSSLNEEFIISNIETSEKKKSGVMPFTTSTLQQACINRFNYNSSKTMRIAQHLYEGVDIGSSTVGLITYMRTDSTRVSPIFINETFKYIEENYGKSYKGVVKKSKKNDNVQDAHEAIRPTDINKTPESLKQYLTKDEYNVYSIIYKRALASLMSEAKVLKTTVNLDNNGYTFVASGQILTFDGYLKVYQEYSSSNDVILPDMTKFNGKISTTDITSEQKFTKPASRYTEASLIQEMEKLGIGRPSTYAKTMDTLKERNYVTVIDKKFHPSDMGIIVTDKLEQYFSNIIDVEYTALMESDLDNIALGKEDNILLLKNFYKDFEPLVENAFDKMEKEQPKETGEICPNCGKSLVVRRGKYGEFIACSGYPECKYIKKEEKQIEVVCKCPKCGNDIIERKTRRGKIFYGCLGYPKCSMALWDKPTGELCPKCASLLVNHKDEIKCSSCDYKN